jgi:Uma2 family endonuclease
MMLGMKNTRRYTRPMSVHGLLTADDLMRLQPRDKRAELVRGRMIVREPSGFRHGDIAMEIAALLHTFVKAHDLGRVLAAETGFVLSSSPDTVRAADAAFVRHDRIPKPVPRGFARFAPNLVVEVLSPSDRSAELLEKVADWLNGGAELVWVIDPERREARVHRANGTSSVIAEASALDGEDVLPGFVCPLSQVL